LLTFTMGVGFAFTTFALLAYGAARSFFAILRAYAIDTGNDSDCRKQHRQSLEVYGVFGAPATAREAVGVSLDGEFCQRGVCRRLKSCEKRNSPIGRKTAPSPLTS
jgi:hypothetical protein